MNADFIWMATTAAGGRAGLAVWDIGDDDIVFADSPKGIDFVVIGVVMESLVLLLEHLLRRGQLHGDCSHPSHRVFLASKSAAAHSGSRGQVTARSRMTGKEGRTATRLPKVFMRKHRLAGNGGIYIVVVSLVASQLRPQSVVQRLARSPHQHQRVAIGQGAADRERSWHRNMDQAGWGHHDRVCLSLFRAHSMSLYTPYLDR